ncbi:DUF4177 domain-containing protein [Clostridium thermobutyricum]|uniref:DUF4177 domain-containing protein n=1 Tax=Clostridium thermobutyricum TaxID=29372 RepID=UPI003F51AFE5
MYEYKFIKLEIKGLFSIEPKQDYHKIIEENAREGWRLVQIFAPPLGTEGKAYYYELIFEKQF